MSGEIDIRDILVATKAELVAMTWDGSSDLVFNHVVITPVWNPDAVWSVAPNIPAAILLDGGATYDEENEEFTTSEVSIVVITRCPVDQFDEAAMIEDRQLLAIVSRLRTLISYYNTHFGAEAWWVSTSAAVPLKRANDPTGFVAKEIRFSVRHMSIVE